MKKIFIILSLLGFFTFLLNNSVSASYFADKYGVNMTYKTLKLYDIVESDFEFTGNWWESQGTTYVFEYLPVEESLEELIRTWQDIIPDFMKVYTTNKVLEYLSNTTSIPADDWGWTAEDGYLYIIITKDYFQEYYPGEPILPIMGDLAELIRVDTWVITETTSDYQIGYDTGYQHGYSSGYDNGYDNGYDKGWEAKEAEINALLPGMLKSEYDRGHDDGYEEGLQVSQGEAYDQGYLKGAKESFMATMDKWLVPAIIIVMLVGGFFAIARKKREGDI